MNPKIEKLRAERNKLAERAASLNARLEALDEKILELENTDIVGIVRESGVTPEQLAKLTEMLKSNPIAALSTEPGKYEEKEKETDESY